MDTRPTWDDTGVTVGALVLTAAAAAATARRRPWVWPVLMAALFVLARTALVSLGG